VGVSKARSGRQRRVMKKIRFSCFGSRGDHVARPNRSTWVSASISIYPCVHMCKSPTVLCIHILIFIFTYSHTFPRDKARNDGVRLVDNFGENDIPMEPLMKKGKKNNKHVLMH